MKKFLTMVGDSDDPTLSTQAELAQANPHEGEILEWMERAVIGETFFGGGGAAADFTITRVRDNYTRS